MELPPHSTVELVGDQSVSAVGSQHHDASPGSLAWHLRWFVLPFGGVETNKRLFNASMNETPHRRMAVVGLCLSVTEHLHAFARVPATARGGRLLLSRASRCFRAKRGLNGTAWNHRDYVDGPKTHWARGLPPLPWTVDQRSSHIQPPKRCLTCFWTIFIQPINDTNISQKCTTGTGWGNRLVLESVELPFA